MPSPDPKAEFSQPRIARDNARSSMTSVLSRTKPRVARWLLSVALVPLGTSLPAQRLHFGTNVVEPGRIVEFVAPMNARARFESTSLRLPTGVVRGAFVAPAGKTNLSTPWRLLIVSVPSGGSALQALPAYVNVALPHGWAVFAADGPRVDASVDSVQLGWGILSSALDQFQRTWPMTKRWPKACAGFSGGAKRAAAMAAALMKEGHSVAGVFMGGCNEDRVTLGLQLYQPGDRFKKVPLFLSNGATDSIAGPAAAATVAESIRRSGFEELRTEVYEGGHRQNDAHLAAALDWFSDRLGSLPRPKP